MARTLKLYTKAGCPWCEEARRWLDARGYGYEEIDVRANPGRMDELVAVSGQSLAPTLVAGTLVLADFDTGQLEAFVNEHGLTPPGA